MVNQSDSRVRESIDRLNEILSPVGNRVLLLDFSHFISVSGQHDNITVKTCGLQEVATIYESTLEKAYEKEGYVKYGVEEREHYFICDFSDSEQHNVSYDYEFGPRRNLSRSKAWVRADTKGSLRWFDIVKASEVRCSSGIVLARGTPSIQSNIYLFLERKFGIESSSAVRLDRQGRATQGFVISEEASKLLGEIFSELNELLRDEMEESAAYRFRQYYNIIAFASHEIANVESNIRTASTLETAKAFGLGLCIALSVGVDLAAGQDQPTQKSSIESVTTILKAHGSLLKKDDASSTLTWFFPDHLLELERWQVSVIFEITRNAMKYLEGQSPPRIHWDIESDEKGVRRMCCVSSPHSIDDPSRWPWQGSAGPELEKGTYIISQLAESKNYVATWTPQALGEDSKYSEAKFELTRKEKSR